MKSLFQVAEQLDEALADRGWLYCFIGGIALQRWGQPRLTTDIDVTVLTGIGSEISYIDELLSLYSGRLPNTRDFALKHRVLLLVSEEGIPIDVALGSIAFEEQMTAMATRHEFLPGLFLPTCSAEELVILKSFADRARDWADIETVLARQQNNLDWSYILEQLRPLCELKENPEIVDRLIRLRDKQ
jgi:hypothetical protein